MMMNFDYISFFLSVPPVPATRPRVSKWGTYYGKRYSEWRKKAAEALSKIAYETPFTCPVCVTLTHVVLKPKTSKRTYPRGDLDNYDKAVLDALTKHANVWRDDDQVLQMYSTKMYAVESSQAGCFIQIEPVRGLKEA